MSTGIDAQQFAEAVADSSSTAAENLSAPLAASLNAAGQFTPTSGQGGYVTTTGTLTSPPPQTFTAEAIEAAREQEKSKLYPQIERMKGELETLQREKAERDAEQAQRDAEAAEEARRIAEQEMTARELIEAQRAEFSEQLAAERAEREHALALLDMERQYQELQAWKVQRVEAERENIMPELLDLVTGNSPEEIEASIQSLRDRTSRILDSAQQAMSSARRDMVGSRITAPAAGPLDTQTGQRQFSPEEIRNMPLSEYQKYRDTLLGTGAASNGRGLFG